MTEWARRPRIAATLLNPALLAAVQSVAAREYERAAGRPMPWPVAFIVAPLVLHSPSREALPSSTRTHLSTWVSRNALIRAGFPKRATELAPFVREGLRFGFRHQVLDLHEGGLRGTLRPGGDAHLSELLTSAGLVGRWLAKTNQPSTAFALFGVAP
ncbi:MAG: hypothetical protein IT386_00635 [Deltaproteobacteria bacterium]|nr:hypothetical protein [Deltaproteobacteria bacterium]